MYYDRYSELIYQWLMDNHMAEKVDSILSLLQTIQNNLIYILITSTFILFVVFIFKFLVIRGRNV